MCSWQRPRASYPPVCTPAPGIMGVHHHTQSVCAVLGIASQRLTEAGHALYQLSYSLANVNDIFHLTRHTQTSFESKYLQNTIHGTQYTVNAHQEVSDSTRFCYLWLLDPPSNPFSSRPATHLRSSSQFPGLMGRLGGYLNEHPRSCWMVSQFSDKSWVLGRRMTWVGLPS